MRTAEQDIARWRKAPASDRAEVVLGLCYDKTHSKMCAHMGDRCPWCIAVDVLKRAARPLAVKVKRR